MSKEDFNKRRLLVKSLVKMDFQKQWQYRIDIVGTASLPAEWDLFVKDISYSSWDIMTEDVAVGSIGMSNPTSVAVATVSMTMRDHADERIKKYFNAWKSEVIRGDGTVGLPFSGPNGAGYLRTVRKYILHDDGSESLSEEWLMFPKTLGDTSQSVENGEFFEFPIVFTQYSTIGT